MAQGNLDFTAYFKGPLSDLSQFWVTEKTLEIMKNALSFTFKALFVFKVFTLPS